MNSSELASITETLLFIVGEPLEAEDIKKVTGATEMELWQAIELLEQKYTAQGGILLKNSEESFNFAQTPLMRDM